MTSEKSFFGSSTATELVIQVAGISDIGCQRSNNEDSFGYDRASNIFVVCDGMGGMAAGEIASSMAVEQTLRTYNELLLHDMSPEQRLNSAIVSANDAVWRSAQGYKTLRGMGTTLVAACVDRNHIVVGNVGDSRAYFLRDGACAQITEDHSCLAEQTRIPRVVSNEVPISLRQFITRAIGAKATVEPDFFVAKLQPGDTVLLATDGLTRYIDAEKIISYIQIQNDLEKICHNLIDIAHDKGAEDNATCLLVRVLLTIALKLERTAYGER